jgi:hypothetical protein
VYYGREQTKEQAFVELVNASLERAVLAIAFHLAPPVWALEEKARWIDSNTHDPEKLKAIERIFGRDTSAYYTLVVSPTLINARLHSVFASDPTVQRDERDSIQKIWAAISKDRSQFYKFKFDTLVTIQQNPTHKALASVGAEQAQDPLAGAVLQHLKPGEMWNNIIEDDNSYKILELLSQNDSAYRSLAIVVQKRPFDPWYRDYILRHVPISFNDTSLLASVSKAYPDIWWLRK